MIFSEITKRNFGVIAKELAKLGSRKVEFKSQKTKEVSIDDKYGANCAIISIEDKTELAITESGDAFLRAFKAKTWDPWSRVIRDNDPILSMLHADNPDSIDPKLTIKGSVRIKNLKGKNLIEKQNPEDLTPAVSDEDGNLISLPYKRGETEDHFIIPILRSRWESLKKHKELRIENLFNHFGDQNVKKLSVEIKLLLNFKGEHSFTIIRIFNNKLHNVCVHGGVMEAENGKNDESLNLNYYGLNLKIVENKKNNEYRDVLIKYSGKKKWINIKYFVTI